MFNEKTRSLLNYVPYVLSCSTCLVPCVLLCPTCLVPSMLSCLTCSRAVHALVPTCPTCLLPYVFSCLTCLTVLLYLTCFVPCVFSGFSCLVHYVLLCSSYLTCFRCFKPNMLLMHLISCSFHAFCLLRFWCFSYLSFLKPGLRLIIVIDNNKGTLNINSINTL